MGSLIRRFGIKSAYLTRIRKIRIAFNVLTGRSAIGIIITSKGRDYIKFDYYKDLSLSEAMTMVVEMKRQVETLEQHIDVAAHIRGEAQTLQALKETMDVTVGEAPTVVGQSVRH